MKEPDCILHHLNAAIYYKMDRLYAFLKSKRSDDPSELKSPDKISDDPMSSAFGANIVSANYVQFWFRRFHSGNLDVKDAPHTGRPVVENLHKITEIIEVNRHLSNHSISHELKISHKTVLSQLHKVGFKKKLDVYVPHHLTPKKQ
ncbi:histone-lysine N-methyltransferase SETMAR [Trichonephila clavipes]|nr:histone-lysine N-methyltransferase SETMAR [Trichonephila clavipes]